MAISQGCCYSDLSNELLALSGRELAEDVDDGVDATTVKMADGVLENLGSRRRRACSDQVANGSR